MVDARDSDGASGTKVREAIRQGNRDAFEQMMPKVLWVYWDELRKYIK
jgi:predicted nucleotidyltransferase